MISVTTGFRHSSIETGEKVLAELSTHISNPDLPMEQLADELIIARLLADATAQAGIKPENLDGAKD